MLEQIRITNLALIDKSIVDFGQGFNVLTGETGAGKSLIVDALLFLTGVRADKNLIKSGEEFARVEGVFSVDNNNSRINDILSSVGLSNDGTILISRYFATNCKNECRINGELVTLNILKKISNELIDIFGQNDSMLLLNPINHLTMMDSVFENSLASDKKYLKLKLSQLSDVNLKIKELGGLDKDRENSLALLKYQIDEIEKSNLVDNEEQELQSKIKIMENSEKIFASLDNVGEILDGEINLSSMIKNAINILCNIDAFDEEIKSEKDRLYSIKYELDDIVSNLECKKSNICYSSDELDRMNDRLALIKNLKRKYGNDIVEILNFCEKCKNKLDMLLNAEEELNKLQICKKDIVKEICNICTSLRTTRKKEIAKFRLKFIEILQKLGMKNANFDVEFSNVFDETNIESIVGENGADQIEFMFSANLGIELRPLSKIISGGEMSRFMLAFKSLQNNENNKTCIFDEIDAGIGGEIGVVIGQKIAEIAQFNQIICITHLAQIASFGDSNYRIEKRDEDNKTTTSVTWLDGEGKIKEIARMLGSASNAISIKHAEEIINDAIAYKDLNIKAPSFTSGQNA